MWEFSILSFGQFHFIFSHFLFSPVFYQFYPFSLKNAKFYVKSSQRFTKIYVKKPLLLIDLHSHSYQKYLKHKWPITLQLKYLERWFFFVRNLFIPCSPLLIVVNCIYTHIQTKNVLKCKWPITMQLK